MHPESPALLELKNSVAILTLNRPQLKNAFDDEMITILSDHLDQISKDQNIRVVILKAAGESFCAGADLHWMKKMVNYDYEKNLTDALALTQLLKKLNQLPQTTLAMVQGSAFGGGVGLVACCDIVFASTNAQFCLSEVKLGLIPAVISPYVIAAIGLQQARRYCLSAERFDAEKAKQFGLVHEVVLEVELEKKIHELVALLLQNGPEAMRAAKQLLQDSAKNLFDEKWLTETAKRIAKIRVSAEGQSGLKAFLEKRKPEWAV